VRFRPVLVVAGLALAAAAPGLGNGFVYDDIPIVEQNPVLRHPESLERIWTTPYWRSGLLYRPLTIQLFALEWTAGGGRPLPFHLVNVALMVGCALLFWKLASRLLPEGAALIAAVLFAVHPVHVESVANVVGQAELLATALTLLCIERYLSWRDDGGLTLGRRTALALITLLAIFSKETGYVIPLLLIAAELLATPPGTGWRQRLRALGPALALQLAVVAAAVLIRITVLGPTTGAGPAVAIRDLPAADRIAGMLAVVPEWARLLYWPFQLQAEYGPPAIEVTGPFGLAHLLGLILLAGTGLLLVRVWRRQPVLGFGLVWIGIALLPVSNLLAPTGVILAERTLFLPSAGAMLALGAVIAWAFSAMPARLRRLQAVGAGGLAILTIGWTFRSVERQLVWREQAGFIRQLELDAPTTYRAQLIASSYYAETNRLSDSERTGARAYALFKGDPQVFEQYGQVLRRQGRCGEALPVLADGVRRFPDRTVARSRLIECALAVGDSARALSVAREGLAAGQGEFAQTIRRLRPLSPPPGL
jgi:hypothetical protein